ncbi:TPA: DnaB-like helicase C-terminal domain-containing protein [Legionella pneumophila]|nr:hypothetical protein [Legionella pneumophila]
MYLQSSLDSITAENALEIIEKQLKELSSVVSGKSKRTSSYKEIIEEILKGEQKDKTQIAVDIDGLPPIPNYALITIAGRVAVEKNLFVTYLMDKIINATPEKQALYFNLETEQSSLNKSIPKKTSLFINSKLTIEEIETQSRLAYLKEPISVIVVNHIGGIETRDKDTCKDWEQIEIAHRLAALSCTLGCVVIVLVQINDNFDNRPIGERCPMLDDAIDFMGTIQSSSWWLGIDQPQIDTDETKYKNLFQIRCRKTRFCGGLFSLDFHFKGGQFFKREPTNP